MAITSFTSIQLAAVRTIVFCSSIVKSKAACCTPSWNSIQWIPYAKTCLMPSQHGAEMPDNCQPASWIIVVKKPSNKQPKKEAGVGTHFKQSHPCQKAWCYFQFWQKIETLLYSFSCWKQRNGLLFPNLDILEEAVVTVVEDWALCSVESPLGSIVICSIPPKMNLCFIWSLLWPANFVIVNQKLHRFKHWNGDPCSKIFCMHFRLLQID